MRYSYRKETTCFYDLQVKEAFLKKFRENYGTSPIADKYEKDMVEVITSLSRIYLLDELVPPETRASITMGAFFKDGLTHKAEVEAAESRFPEQCSRPLDSSKATLFISIRVANAFKKAGYFTRCDDLGPLILSPFGIKSDKRKVFDLEVNTDMVRAMLESLPVSSDERFFYPEDLDDKLGLVYYCGKYLYLYELAMLYHKRDTLNFHFEHPDPLDGLFHKNTQRAISFAVTVKDLDRDKALATYIQTEFGDIASTLLSEVSIKQAMRNRIEGLPVFTVTKGRSSYVEGAIETSDLKQYSRLEEADSLLKARYEAEEQIRLWTERLKSRETLIQEYCEELSCTPETLLDTIDQSMVDHLRDTLPVYMCSLETESSLSFEMKKLVKAMSKLPI